MMQRTLTPLCISESMAGASSIKILEHKFYALLILMLSDWLKNLSGQSKCLKISIA